MLKRYVSWILVVTLLFGMLCIAPSASAEEANKAGEDYAAGVENDNLSMTGENSLGNMLAAEYANADPGEEEETFCRIYAVEIEGRTARAELSTFTDAQLIVSLFDDNGEQMLGSGMTEVTSEDSVVEMTLELEDMPPHFLVRAFLLDANTNLPLCKQYENDFYTQKMQEFFAKTTDDFDEERVFNLDEDQDNNFLVYDENTIVIDKTDDNTNIITKADDENLEYVIENIDEKISSLKTGDVFAYNDGETSIIVRIASITFDGDTATIMGEEIGLRDVFDYIRIDASKGIGEENVDLSGMDEDLEFVGFEEEEPAPTGDEEDLAGTGFDLIDEDKIAEGTELKYDFLGESVGTDSLKAKVTGSISVKIDVALTCYYEKELFEKDEAIFKFNAKYSLGLDLGFEFSATKKWELGKLAYPLIPGAIHATLTANFVVRGKITGNVNGKITGQIGYKYVNGKWESDDKQPHFEAEIKFEASVFIGLSIEPAIEVTALGAATVIKGGGELECGVTVKAKLAKKYDASKKKERHECSVCIEGELYFSVNCSVTLKFLESERLQMKGTITPYEAKLTDCYYSFDYEEFGWSKCPHKEYLSTFSVMKEDPDTKELSPLPGAAVSISKLKEEKEEATGQVAYVPSGKTYTETTDSKGYAELFLPNCFHDVEVTCEKMKPSSKRIKVTKTDTYTFILTPEEEPTEPPTEPPTEAPTQAPTEEPTEMSTEEPTEAPTEAPTEDLTENILDSGQCGDNAYWKLFNGGVLVIYGTGDMYDGYYSFGWKKYTIYSVVVQDGITSIGDGAFSGAQRLSAVILQKHNTIKRIGYGAFATCYSLQSIVIPDGVELIDADAFMYCSSLQEITLPKSVTTIERCFGFCNLINKVYYAGDADDWSNISIDTRYSSSGNYNRYFLSAQKSFGVNIYDDLTERYPNINDDTVDAGICGKNVIWALNKNRTVIIGGTGSMYSNDASPWVDYKIKKAVIFDGITNITSYLFRGCECLDSVAIPDSVTQIGSFAFKGCSSLSDVSIPDSVTAIGNDAFNGCESLTNIAVPEAVTKIEKNTFCDCISLSSITISDHVTSLGESAFSNCSALLSINIPDSVTYMGKGAFSGCVSMTSFTIPAGVKTINSYLFDDCTSLESVVLHDSITSIGGSAFSDCSSLTSFTIPHSVKSIESGAFYNCTSLKRIDIPDTVTSIGGSVFFGCTGIETVNTGNGITTMDCFSFSGDSNLTSVIIGDSVKSVGNYAFRGCSNLQSVSIGNAVSSIGWYAFSGCWSLQTVTIGGPLTEIDNSMFIGLNKLRSITIPASVTRIGASAFSGCTSLLTIEIPEGVTSIEDSTFSQCSGLTELVIPEAVTSIGDSAFSHCSGLTELVIPEAVTSIGDSAFSYCSGLTDIIIPDTVTTIGENAFYSCTGLKNVKLSDAIIKINKYLFSGCTELTGIIIPDPVKEIGYYAFYNCKSLNSVTMPDGVTEIGSGAFKGCSGLESVTIPDAVTAIGGYAFSDCTGLKSIYLSDSLVSIGSYAFENCSEMERFAIPDTVTSLGYNLISGCSSLEYINTGNGITTLSAFNNFKDNKALKTIIIGDSVKTINSENFSSCKELESVTIGNSVERIGERAFNGCSCIKSIIIPDSVTSIDSGAFSYCSCLETVSLADSVASMGTGVFRNCSSLTSITLPSSLSSIGYDEFYGCSSLTSITIPASVTSISDAFSGCTSLSAVHIYDLDAWCRVYFSNSRNNPLSVAHNLYLYDELVTDLVIPDSITQITNSSFTGCTSLESVSIPDSVTDIKYHSFYGCTSLTDVTLGDSVASIGNSAFKGCTGLTSVSFPNSTTSIGDDAFYGCTGLTSVAIPDSVTNLGSHPFLYCTNLEYVNTGNGISSLDSFIFSGNLNLKTVVIGDSVTSIDDSAFRGCKGLMSVTIGNSVTSIGSYAFYECTGLTSLDIPDSVTHIDNSAFTFCGNLEYVNTGNGVSTLAGFNFGKTLKTVVIGNSVTSIGSYKFSGFTGLTSVTIGNSVTSIGNAAFKGCTGLTSMTIPDLVTSIEYDLFNGCTGLTSVTIPDSVTSIGSNAFSGCTSLENIYYGGSESEWNQISLGVHNDFSNVTIHFNSTGPVDTGVNAPEDSPAGTGASLELLSEPKKASPVLAQANTAFVADEAENSANFYYRFPLVPNTEAVLVILKGDEETAELSASNLLYIAQGTVDEDGEIFFEVGQDFGDVTRTARIYAQCDHAPTTWKTILEPTYDSAGVKIHICDYCGELIDSQQIPSLSAYLLGDADGSGRVEVVDTTWIQRHIAELETPYSETELLRGDADGSGALEIVDVTAIQYYLAKLWTPYAIGELVG